MKFALAFLFVGLVSAATIPEQPLRFPLPKDVAERMPWLVDEPMTVVQARDADTKVVGGENAAAGFAPFQIALERSNSFTCGGSFISARTVLTAAHCVYGSESTPSRFRIRYSTIDRTSGPTIAISKVIRHASYSSNTIDYDVAVLIMENEFAPSDNAKVIKLASSDPADGSTVSLTGWGRLTGGGSLPIILQKADLKTLSKADCQKAWGSVATVSDRMLCAGDEKRSACNGDSGGPLTFGGAQVGVVSWGSSTCSNYPNVYARVSNLKSWIDSNTQ